MKIDNLSLEKNDGTIAARASVTWEDNDRPRQELFWGYHLQEFMKPLVRLNRGTDPIGPLRWWLQYRRPAPI